MGETDGMLETCVCCDGVEHNPHKSQIIQVMFIGEDPMAWDSS